MRNPKNRPEQLCLALDCNLIDHLIQESEDTASLDRATQAWWKSQGTVAEKSPILEAIRHSTY